MAILFAKPVTTHRDNIDTIKFPGKFIETEYDGGDGEPEESWDLTHRVQFARPAAAAGGGTFLDPLHRFLAVKNMGKDPVLLHLNTQANGGNPAFEVSILPGMWVIYVDLLMTVQPSIRVASALYSTPMECEVIQIGRYTPIEEIPEEFCDLWAVGHVTQAGVLTKHHPEIPGPWEVVANPLGAEANHWLADVAGVAVDDYWAVGYDTVETFPANGLFMQWNGAVWAEVLVESDPPQYGIWGFATDDFWSVGGPVGGGPGEIWHFVVGWTLDCIPDPEGTDTFYCVHGNIPANIYAAGSTGLIASYNGVAWVVHPPPVESPECNFYGTWTSPVGNAYICGGDADWWDGPAGGIGWIFIEAPPGSAFWQSMLLPPGTPTLRAMWGFSDSDIWVVGDAGTILHYDGVNWIPVPEPAELETNYDYRGVFGCQPWDVTAIGTNKSGTNVIIHWDGVVWTVIDGPDLLEGDALGLKGTVSS